MPKQRRYFLALSVKNEAPNLLEWVAYHRLIGFTDIAIYQNDSTDGSQKILRTMMKAGYIQYFRNHNSNEGWQNKAYRRASRLDAFKAADWAMALDADEFLVIRPGDGKLDDLVDALPQGVNCATINWKLFGSSYHTAMPEGLVSEAFTRAEPPERIAARMAGFKTLFKPSAFERIGTHKPRRIVDSHSEVCASGSGEILEDGIPSRWRSRDPAKRKLAQVNHYALRDLQRFLVKSARGRAGNHDRMVDMKYWRDFEFNQAEDLALARWAPAIRAEMAAMDQKSRGRLSKLTGEARAGVQASFEELLKDPYYRGIHEEISQTFKNPG